MIQTLAHYGCHFIIPLFIAFLFFKSQWQKAYIIMILGMLIDLDHLLATPIFDPNRCSIDFHPLHTYYALLFYIVLTIPKKTRIVGIGLLIHMFADFIDCAFM